jgi:hypothetical protein
MPNYVPVDFEAFFKVFSEYFFGLPKKIVQKDEFIFVRCGCSGPGKEYHKVGIGKRRVSPYL